MLKTLVSTSQWQGVVPRVAQMLKKLGLFAWSQMVRYSVGQVLAIRVRVMPPERLNRVLIIRTDGIGDAILFSGCLKHIRRHYVGAETIVVAREYVGDMYLACPHVDGVMPWNSERFTFDVLYRYRFLRKLAGHGVRAVLCPMFEFTRNTAEILGAIDADEAIVFKTYEGRTPRSRSLKVTDTTKWSGREIDLYRFFLHSMDPKLPLAISHAPELWQSKDVWVRLTSSHAVFGKRRYIAVVPAGSWAGKTWPTWKWVCVLKHIAESYPTLDICLLGGRREMALCADLAAQLPQGRICDLSGMFSLEEYQAVIASASLYIGADTGAVHMAVASGVPTVCLIGGGHEKRFFPYGDETVNIAVSKPMECFGCGWKCVHSSVKCIEDISIEEVCAAVEKQLNRICNVVSH